MYDFVCADDFTIAAEDLPLLAGRIFVSLCEGKNYGTINCRLQEKKCRVKRHGAWQVKVTQKKGESHS
jgi:hypothetical protein